MRLHLFECICARCHARFKAPQLFGGYGVLQLRSAGQGAEAFVDTFTHGVFDEVSELVDGVPGVSALRGYDRGSLVQAVFGVACDPDSDGTPFVIGEEPHCPSCGCQTMASWRATDPPEIVDLDVPHVTHERWSRLTGDDRAAAVRRAVEKLLP